MKKFLKFIVIIIFSVLIVSSVCIGYIVSIKNNIKSSELPSKKVDIESPVNVLLLGVDAGDYDNKNNRCKRSDTIILVRYIPNSNKIYMLSIPRDTRVNINGHYEKINAAHSIGGVPLAVKTVEKLLGVNINYYFKVDYEAFRKCVDAIGGIDVVVPVDMDYDAYDISIHFKKGDKVHLDGKEAEKFIRWRKNNDGSGYAMGDLGRISTQQEFILEVVKKLKTPVGIIKIPALIDTMSMYVKTNMDTKTMLNYVIKLKDIDTSRIEKKVLEGEAKYISGISYFLYSKEKNKDYLANFRNDENEVSKDKIKIVILNSTGKSGLAAKYRDILASYGYNIVEIGNYSKKLNTTQINDNGDGKAGNMLLMDLGVGKVKVNKNNNKADVIVILGEDAIK